MPLFCTLLLFVSFRIAGISFRIVGNPGSKHIKEICILVKQEISQLLLNLSVSNNGHACQNI